MWGRRIAASLFAFGLLAGAAAGEAKALREAGLNNQRIVPVRKTSGGKLPPFAYIQMCVKHPGLCNDKPGRLAKADSKVRITKSLSSQLAEVNSAVNRQIRPAQDAGADTWSVNVTRGDCEDYVLTKRARLLAMGWPSSALSIAIVRTRWGEKHAVLVVDTDNGRYVLDNLNRNVLPISRAPYQFLAMQVAGSKRHWQ